MKKILDVILKYKAIISYLFFGVCTTVINMICYYVFYNIFNVTNIISTIIAWVFAVVFAYITNKLFVFDSRSFRTEVILKEILSFFGYRLLTGVLDVAVMYIAVDLLIMNSTLWKLISNSLVIILNYIASRLVIFRNNVQK